MKQKTLEYKVLKHILASTEAVIRAQTARINDRFFTYREEGDDKCYTKLIFILADSYYTRSGGLILTDLEFERQVRNSDKITKRELPRLMHVWEEIKVEDHDDNEIHTLLELLKERALIRMFRDMVQKGHTAIEEVGLDGATDMMGQYLDEINEIKGEGAITQTSLDLKESAEYFEREVARRRAAGEDEGIMTGLGELDHTTQGMRPGQMGVVVSRSSGGKSLFLMGAGAHAYHCQGKSVVYFSVEMEVWQCFLRHLSWLTKTNHKLLKSLKFSEDDQKNIMTILSPLSEGEDDSSPYFIYDYFAREPTAEYVERRLRQITRERGRPHLVIVDYVGRMSTAKSAKNAKMWERAGEAGVELLRIAGTLGLAMWTAAQQNRPSISEQRKSKERIAMDQDMVAGAHQLTADATYVIGINSNREDMTMVIEPIKIREGGWFTPFICKVNPDFNEVTQFDPEGLREWREMAGYPTRTVNTEAEATSGHRTKLTRQADGGVKADLRMTEHSFGEEDLVFEIPETWETIGDI